MTDYVSPQLAETLIERGKQSCFMVDKNGFLPAHIACSRHCSPEKLEMLLEVNPASLFAKTYNGSTLLSLAKSTATKSHPNYALINEIRRRMDLSQPPAPAAPAAMSKFNKDPFRGPDQCEHEQSPPLSKASALTSNCSDGDVRIEHRHLLVNL